MGQNDIVETFHEGEGYAPLVDYNGWRVAVANYAPHLTPSRVPAMEKHLETDEVFVLLTGKAIIYTAGQGEQPLSLAATELKPKTIYNVKANVWHCINTSQDASILIVENENTGLCNTCRANISLVQRADILNLANQLNFIVEEEM